MSERKQSIPGLLLLATGWLGGCGQTDLAPPELASSSSPALVFLVHNEVSSIRLDGTDRHTRGSAGDDKYRTGWPRFLPDGRIAVLANDTGAIFPYLSDTDHGSFRRLPQMQNVTTNDSLCGASVGGASRLVFTITPFLPTRTRVERVDVDASLAESVHFEPDGMITNPSPYDDGRVLVVRTARGVSTIEILDVAGPDRESRPPEVLASVEAPYLAAQPARLADGRVVFIRIDPRDPNETALGEIWVIGLDGAVASSGLTGVLGLIAIDDKIVYEVGGQSGISDLVYTDLVNPPVNITNTPWVSEHLGWSD